MLNASNFQSQLANSDPMISYYFFLLTVPSSYVSSPFYRVFILRDLDSNDQTDNFYYRYHLNWMEGFRLLLHYNVNDIIQTQILFHRNFSKQSTPQPLSLGEAICNQ